MYVKKQRQGKLEKHCGMLRMGCIPFDPEPLTWRIVVKYKQLIKKQREMIRDVHLGFENMIIANAVV